MVGAVRALAEEVLLVRLLPLAADLGIDLHALRGRLDLHVVLRHPGQLRRDDELRALVADINRGHADAGHGGEAGSRLRGPQAPEVTADVVEPPGHLPQKAERVRHASPQRGALARLQGDLGSFRLAHHRLTQLVNLGLYTNGGGTLNFFPNTPPRAGV